MPQKLSNEYVREELRRYGYVIVEPDWMYVNNSTPFSVKYLDSEGEFDMSWKQFKQNVDRGHFKLYRHNDPFNKWLNKHGDDDTKQLPPDLQRVRFDSKSKYIKKLKLKKNFTIDLSDEYTRQDIIAGFIEAAKVVIPTLIKQQVLLTLLDSFGQPEYRILNANTIRFLDQYFRDSSTPQVGDSTEDIINIPDLVSISVEFIPVRAGSRKVGGFFPFINESGIDLSRYGIYSSTDHPEINDSCLYTSFKSSSLLTPNELSLLRSFIITRMIPQTQLRDIAITFKICISVKKVYTSTGKSSCDEYGPEFKSSRSINLLSIYEHYMLNETVNVTEFYVKHINEINNDPRFINHPRKMMLKKCSPKRYEFAKVGVSVLKLIRLLIKHDLMKPLTDEQINHLDWSFETKECITEGVSRLIRVDDKIPLSENAVKVNQTQHFFGYKPNVDEIPQRLNELQSVIDELDLRKRIDVTRYYKFSDLMQKIMYEYGCFDDVYELSGATAQSIRRECIFPKHNHEPFYSNEKLYYIDLNGAYMSCIKGIPTGKYPFNNELNTKIKDLIDELYEARSRAKRDGLVKLSITLKYLMNSCWGYSIKRPKIIKHKFCDDVDKYVDTFAPFVVKYKYLNGSSKGFVDTIQSFVPHFTTPQFAKAVLDTFNEKMEKVRSLVQVLYQNVDAILIRESDYKKLVEMGFVGDELGQFKIEHIFTEFAKKSGRQYVAKLESGERFFHCVRSSVDYDRFVDEVKNMIE